VKEYWFGAHTKHRLMYHLVWLPKYRKRILQGKIVPYLEGLFSECCIVNSWEITELNIQKDHVHMIIRIRPSVSVSNAVQRLKGGSSRMLRKKFPGLKEFLWGNSFWSDGYFAETVGSCDELVIRKYVANQ